MSNISLLFHSENKLHFVRWWWFQLFTRLTRLVASLSLIQQSAGRHVVLLRHWKWALEASIANHYTTGEVHFWLRCLYLVIEVRGHVYVFQGYRFCLFLQFFNCISGTVSTVMYYFLFHFIPSNENYFLLAIL